MQTSGLRLLPTEIRICLLSSGMAQEPACPVLRSLHRQLFLSSTARSQICLRIEAYCSSSTFSSVTSLLFLSTMSTSTRPCGGTPPHILPHTHHWWVLHNRALLVVFIVVSAKDLFQTAFVLQPICFDCKVLELKAAKFS